MMLRVKTPHVFTMNEYEQKGVWQRNGPWTFTYNYSRWGYNRLTATLLTNNEQSEQSVQGSVGCFWRAITTSMIPHSQERDCMFDFHTSSLWHHTSTWRTLVHPTPAVEERAATGQGDCFCLLWWDDHHTNTLPYIRARTYTQKLSIKPIPPNGRTLILLTGAQGGNEDCHLYIHDPWLTPLPHVPPPSWPGNGTLLGWDKEDRNRERDHIWMEHSDTNTTVFATQISPQMGSKPVLIHLFCLHPTHPHTHTPCFHSHNC